MEPRDFWDRNTVLAEAFCASDERVRQAQSVLDEAQADRRRTLAAFAVTVGRDGTIADLMGLNEREVRSARRTVGRSGARTTAERLLSHPLKPRTQEPAPTAAPAPEQTPAHQAAPAPAATPACDAAPAPPTAVPEPVTPAYQEEYPTASHTLQAPHAAYPPQDAPLAHPPLDTPAAQAAAAPATDPSAASCATPEQTTGIVPPTLPEAAGAAGTAPSGGTAPAGTAGRPGDGASDAPAAAAPSAVPASPFAPFPSPFPPFTLDPAQPVPCAAGGLPQNPTTSTTGHAPERENAVVWTSSMDSVLLWSWKSGLDLQTVAAELGLDVRTLLMRVQVLADDGLLSPAIPPGHSAPATAAAAYPSAASPASAASAGHHGAHPSYASYTSAPVSGSSRAASAGTEPGFAPYPSPNVRRASGRHRRRHDSAYAAFFSPTTTFPTYEVQH